MRVLVMENHDGYGVFPVFPKGTPVRVMDVSAEYPHWYSCVIEGHETFVADVFVSNGVLAQDYNPTEMVVSKGEMVALVDIVYEWLYVRSESGGAGWLPASKATSIPE